MEYSFEQIDGELLINCNIFFCGDGNMGIDCSNCLKFGIYIYVSSYDIFLYMDYKYYDVDNNLMMSYIVFGNSENQEDFFMDVESSCI